MHTHSSHTNAPFVTITADTIPNEQTTVALFNNESDNIVSTELLEQAQNNTLYLDEITKLGTKLQLRLSNALKQQQILQINKHSPKPLDIHIITTNTQNLKAQHATRHLHDELYFQLNVLPIHVPTLHEHQNNIKPLLTHYSQFFATHNNLPTHIWPKKALILLHHHTWPNNLHELRTLTQHLALLNSDPISTTKIEPMLHNNNPRIEATDNNTTIDLSLTLREAHNNFKHTYLLRQLQNTNNSIKKLTQLYNIKHTHLYHKLHDLNIDIKNST